MDNVFDNEIGREEDFSEINEQAQRILESAKERLQPVDEWVRKMAQEHPVASLAGAIGIGYVIGRLLARR